MAKFIYNKQAGKSSLTLFLNVLLISFLLIEAKVAHAAVGGAHADIDTLLWPVINFSLYVLLMYFLYRKFACPVLRDYRSEVESVSIRAQSENNALKSEFEQLSKDLQDIDKEKASYVMELEKEGRSMATDIISVANEKVESMLLDTDSRAKTVKLKIEHEVRQILVDKVMENVKDKLSKNFSEQEDREMIKSNLMSEVFISK